MADTVEQLLYRAIRELEYVRVVGCGSETCASSNGLRIVNEGMELLGLKDLEADELPQVLR